MEEIAEQKTLLTQQDVKRLYLYRHHWKGTERRIQQA